MRRSTSSSPFSLVSTGFDPGAVAPGIVAIVGTFAIDAGVGLDTTKEEVEEKFNAFLAKHPLNPELVFEVRRGIRESNASPDHVAGAFAKYFARPARSLPPAKRGTSPEGSIAAGPLARFHLAC
jgi:hypothetical protein